MNPSVQWNLMSGFCYRCSDVYSRISFKSLFHRPMISCNYYRSHKRWKQRCSLQPRIILSKTPSSSWSKIQILDMFLEWSHSEALYTKQDLLILDRWRYLNLWKGKQSQKGHRQNCQVQLFCPKWWHDSNKRPKNLLEIQIPYIVASQPITLTYLPPEIADLLQCVLTISFPSSLHKALWKKPCFSFRATKCLGGWVRLTQNDPPEKKIIRSLPVPVDMKS